MTITVLVATYLQAFYDGSMLLAKTWPDGFDMTVTVTVLAMVLLASIAGYICMVMDIRAYIRRLRGTLVVVVNYFTELPAWATEATPRCLSVFGLDLPCTEEDLLCAYRTRVKILHPDRGGDRRKFHRLQSHFELALDFLREREAMIQGETKT